MVPSGLDLNGIDHSVKPYDDFYAFANGNWKEEIPSDKAQWGQRLEV